MNNAIVLVVEDDIPVRNLIITTLKTHDYKYLTAGDGKEAILMASSHNPDVVFLDLGLPDMDGIEVIKTIREWSSVIIIIISARSEDSDKIKALDSGADDYLTKPFSVDELLARIRAAQRRLKYIANQGEENPLFINGPLTIDYASNLVTICGQEIHLTSLEYKLLTLLAKNVGKVLTHSYIIEHIWGNAVDSDIVSLRVYMNSLRKKLRQVCGDEELITTHIGIGYQMIRK